MSLPKEMCLKDHKIISPLRNILHKTKIWECHPSLQDYKIPAKGIREVQFHNFSHNMYFFSCSKEIIENSTRCLLYCPISASGKLLNLFLVGKSFWPDSSCEIEYLMNLDKETLPWKLASFAWAVAKQG